MSTPSNLDATTGKYLGNTIWNRGFIAMCVTQFTVAMNDNLFRWLIVPIGKAYVESDLIRTLGGVFLLIPFLLWTSIAGYYTDKHSKRNVMVWCKAVELVLLFVASLVICMGPAVHENPNELYGIFGTFKIPFLLFLLFLLGSQSTFFSPSKYGSIPELVPEEKLSEANGVISMLTMIACVSGQILGGYVFVWTTLFKTVELDGKSTIVPHGTPGTENWGLVFGFLVGTALVGLIASCFIPKLKAVDPKAVFPKNFFRQTGRDIATLYSYRNLFWVAIASAFFWGLAALAVINIDKFATDGHLHLSQQYASILAAILSIGIAFGAVICGYLSRGRIEMGLVPIGALGIGVFLILLGFTPGLQGEELIGTPWSFSFVFACVTLFLAGTAAGFYDIPLSAYIQKHSPEEIRGRLIAAYNFFTFSAMLVFTGSFYAFSFFFEKINSLVPSFLAYPPSLSIWIVTGIAVLVVFYLLVRSLFLPFMNMLFTLAFMFLYRMKVIGEENLPSEGGALLVSNHVGLLDGMLIYTAARRPIRFFAHAHYIPTGLCDKMALKTGVIRVLPGKKVVGALKEARTGLKNGDHVCIFAEGGITRTGQTRAFENGFLSILKGDENVPIIPVYIGGFYGSMFSYKYGSNIIAWPRKMLQRVIVAFGKPIYPPNHPKNASEMKRYVDELGIEAMKQNTELPTPATQLVRNCRKRGNREFAIDTTGVNLSGNKFLAAIIALQRILRREVLAPDERNVGLFVPMAVGGELANAVLAIDGRAAINLNYTFTEDILNGCIAKAEIKTILTSRKMMERFSHLKLNAKLVYVEELLTRITTGDKIVAGIGTHLLPKCLLERMIGVHKIKPSDTCAIIFTSGSTGVPKGVVLSNRNISEQARSFIDVVRLTDKEVLVGFLPLFHAFGYVGNFWLHVLTGCKGVFHFNPLEPKIIGELAREHKCTFIPSTPTFLRNYMRRCPKEDFEGVQTVLCGAEKFPIDLINAWERKYGVRPAEGYGTTELSPCPSVNLPDCRITDNYNKYRKDGSVGRPLSNIMIKIVNTETGEVLGPNEIGMILFKGPTVMQGYYNEPEKTAEVISPDGWYTTGDIGKVDEDGFLWITGRESRISKIGGEMIPHILIEEKILSIIQALNAGEAPAFQVAVSSVPDEKKGERIIVLYENCGVSPETIHARMLEEDIPNLWIPSLNSFFEVEKVPLLGTGKVDLAAIKKLAEQLAGTK